MNKQILLSCLLFLLVTLCHAQTIKITGHVIDDDTEEAMPFCNVFVLGTNTGVLTDIDGNYFIEVDISFADSLATSSLGYDNVLKIIHKKLSEQEINFRMISMTMDLGVEVVVMAGENPANEIIRQINKHKKQNDIEKIAQSYNVEVYSKVELDLVNIIGLSDFFYIISFFRYTFFHFCPIIT